MGYISLLILFILISYLIYNDVFNTQLPKKILLISWSIKIVVSFIFILIFAYFYGNGNIYGDVGNFIKDGKVLNDYAKTDFVGYLKVLFGFNTNDTALLQSHLADTQIWSYAENGDLINDNRLNIRINSIIHFFSFGNIYVHFLVFSFLSFAGISWIYKTFKDFISLPRFFFLALVLLPTFSFWSSGVTKEAIFVFAVGLFFYSVHLIFKKKWKVIHLIALLISIAILLFNKPHLGLVIIPLVFIPLIGYRNLYSRKSALFIIVGVVAGFTIFCFTPDKINIVSRISQKQSDLINMGHGGIFFVNDSSFCAFDYKYLDHFEHNRSTKKIQVLKETKGEYKLFGRDDFHKFTIHPSDKSYDVYLVFKPSSSFVDVPKIDSSIKQLIANTPLALTNVMIRPIPTDGGSNFKHIIFIENIFFLLFLGICIFHRKTLQPIEKSWVLYLLISAVVLILIIGWTTPILGAVVRYKMAPQLLLLISGFILIDRSKIKRWKKLST